ncbi:MAG: MOSC domain-containing protein [Anaerolineae bacterium]|nr:MOSC domain-containing protein [Anaerolineae bacterium]
MKVLVAYYSQTGNTKQIAEVIHSEVLSRGYEADLKPLAALTPESLNGYDLVFMGSACHSSDLAMPVKALLEAIAPSPPFRLAGFATHSTYTPEGDARRRVLYEAWAGQCTTSFERTCQEKGIAWCGYFGCQGAPSAPIEVFIHQTILTDAEEWEAYIADARTHPDEGDKEEARVFARRVLAAGSVGSVVAVCRKAEPGVPKYAVDAVELIEDFGITGDYHAGKFVRHRYLAKLDPTMPNHRHVLITDTVIFADVALRGIDLEPGMMAENIVVDGVSVMALPLGTRIGIGETLVELTEKRDPCGQLNGSHPRLLEAVSTDENGQVCWNAGMFARILKGGRVRPGDAVVVQSQPEAV